ncbi:MAG: HAD-IC family P-type ATPase [Candidatus Bathyarchaeota archaeon]|nr:HAD-IC family P-type ATPase [Candidatus Bathyarchaeota archaeon]
MHLKGSSLSILRTGKIVNIREDELQKEDILLLQAGDLVAADVKLIGARGLEVDEFDLTGEIMPVEKKVDKEEEVFVYKGSRIIRGNGKGIVVAIGEETEYGKILKQRWGQVKYNFPPLIKRKYFILIAFLLPPLFAFVSYNGDFALISLTFLGMAVFILLLQNDDLFKYFLLSSEIKKLVSKKILFHDETSLENLSETDVVCFDKTGVLTTREIEVKRIFFADQSPDMEAFVSNEGIFSLTKTASALCNDVIFFERINQADPIDRALISFALKNGVDMDQLGEKYNRTYEKPFDSEDRYMSAGFSMGKEKIYFVKGDPEIILKMCRRYAAISGVENKIDLNFLSSIKTKSNIIDASGDRTIALAYSFSTLDIPPPDYTFLCLVQFENPLKPEASEVVKTLKETGIRPLAVTGDRPETALKVASAVGIADESSYVLTGKTMERMDFSEIAKQSQYISAYARLLPSQKGLLVRLLKQRNKFVVMVGDGANDTVALKVADAGISFRANSSPFAERVSKILINDLSDLVTIILNARRAKARIKYLRFLRITVLAAIFLVSYYLLLNIVLISI